MTAEPAALPNGPEDYAAQLDHVYDGDTIWLLADQRVTVYIGFGEQLQLDASKPRKYRLARCNCPEMSTPAGEPARAYTAQWLADNAHGLRVKVLHADNYAQRWDAEVYSTTTGRNLSDDLLATGHAVPM